MGHSGRRRIVVVDGLRVQSTQIGVVGCVVLGVEVVMVGGVEANSGLGCGRL